jgi:tyrosyl-tRNA synthetase
MYSGERPPHRVRPTPSCPHRLAPPRYVQEEELKALLKVKTHPVCYDGFEPSGRMHIAQGILKAINVNKLTAAGCVFKFWVADWFALLNNKMGGDLKKIKTVGAYMVEVWKAAGMDMSNVEFLWASDEINGHSNEYWLRVMDIARKFNVPRIVRCCTIMGRTETEDLSAAQIFYPAMQCADIFHLKVRSLPSPLLPPMTSTNRWKCSQRFQGVACYSACRAAPSPEQRHDASAAFGLT